jgi:hypothetical protein
VLATRHPKIEAWPAPSTAADLLARRGLVKKRRRRRSTTHPGVVQPNTAAPNDLWTADFKGQFRTGDGLYCCPLTIADQHTRFLLSCRGVLSTQTVTARPVFERAFREYGLPNHRSGSQWAKVDRPHRRLHIESRFPRHPRMSTRYRLVFFGLSIALVTTLGRWQTGSFEFVTQDFWYASGLLLLILLSLIDQPHFSTSANVFLNGVAGLVALTTVLPADRGGLWNLFFCWSLYLAASSYGLLLVRTKPLEEEGRLTRFLTRTNRTIGRPDALFSAFFVWGLLTQFGPESAQFRVLVLFWGIFIVLNVPSVAATLSEAFNRSEVPNGSAVGRVTKILSPRIAEVQVKHDAPAHLVGRRTTLSSGNTVCAFATVIDDRVMANVRLVTVALTETTSAWGTVARADGQAAELRLQAADGAAGENPVSFVDRGSDIATLRFYVNPQVLLQEGEVLTVRLSSGVDAYYQAVGAEITQERSEPPHSIQEVRVTAAQLGTWDPGLSRFDPVPWVAPAGELVHRVGSTPLENRPTLDGRVEVGTIPNSSFPIHVGLDDAVTHNTAIVGVTGSGKSYLSFRLIEALVARGVKVLVLDVTRQHWAFLQGLGPVAVRTAAELKAWLQSDGLLAVHQFADAASYPARTADFVDVVFKHYEASTELRAGINEPAHLCVLLEEAHSLIPEWNQVAVDDDKRHVNRTSRSILQGRKFGLGCIVVTQRTANVTKTILNQCNTIFAMQSFDQTGLEFLRNYMGDAYAGAMSTLPPRHAILVGKASSSARPVLIKVADLSTRWTKAEVPGELPNGVQLPADAGVPSTALGATAAPLA